MEEQNENNEIMIKIENIEDINEICETVTRKGDSKNYKCSVEGCDAAFNKPSRLAVHMRKHTTERPFQCDECEKTYTNESHLRRHKKAAHPEDGVIGSISCPHEGCMRQLANVYSLRKHIHRYHNPLRKYSFECDQCNAGFFRKSQLNVHMSTHTGKPPYQCESCNMGFMQKTHYTKHLIYHKTFECECGNTFTRWTVFCEHKRGCQKCVKTFKCEYCSKLFQAKNKYNQHVKSHLEDTPKFFCTFGECNRVYKYERNLRVHINRFHKKILPKKVKCTFEGCDKEFVSNNNLKYHLQLHENPYKPKFPRNIRKDRGKPKKSSTLSMTGLTLPYEAEKMIVENKEANIYLNSDTDGIYSSDANTNINSDVTDNEIEQNSPHKRKHENSTSDYDNFLTPSTSGIKYARVKKENSESYENENKNDVQRSIKRIKTEKIEDSTDSTSEISEQIITSHDESDHSEVLNIKEEPMSETSDQSDTDQVENSCDDFGDSKININIEKTDMSDEEQTNTYSESDNVVQSSESLTNSVYIKTENYQNDLSETEQSFDEEFSNSHSDQTSETDKQNVFVKKEVSESFNDSELE